MSVILIGYRGSGKTTVGQLLAARLGQSFVDSDEHITATVGKTIKEIFEAQGEAKFRDHETNILLDLMKRKDHVISLGGGTILAEKNRNAIQSSGHHVIYLHAPAEELHRRIHNDPATAANRPNLTALGGNVEEIRAVLGSREPIYRSVMHTAIDVSNQTPNEVVDLILQSMSDK